LKKKYFKRTFSCIKEWPKMSSRNFGARKVGQHRKFRCNTVISVKANLRSSFIKENFNKQKKSILASFSVILKESFDCTVGTRYNERGWQAQKKFHYNDIVFVIAALVHLLSRILVNICHNQFFHYIKICRSKFRLYLCQVFNAKYSPNSVLNHSLLRVLSLL